MAPAIARPAGTVLETERLFLRQFEPSDVDALAEILGDPETMRYYPHPKSREETEGWIDRSRRSNAEHGFGLWAGVLKMTGRLIGDCGLTIQSVEEVDLVEVGYHLNRRYWHQGFATEAALACRDHAFEAVGADRLIALIRPENEPSCRLAKRLGMSVWRRIERGGMPNLVYAMTREEWASATRQPTPGGNPRMRS